MREWYEGSRSDVIYPFKRSIALNIFKDGFKHLFLFDLADFIQLTVEAGRWAFKASHFNICSLYSKMPHISPTVAYRGCLRSVRSRCVRSHSFLHGFTRSVSALDPLLDYTSASLWVFFSATVVRERWVLIKVSGGSLFLLSGSP